jgi:hypothetical protein
VLIFTSHLAGLAARTSARIEIEGILLRHNNVIRWTGCSGFKFVLFV